MTILTTMTSSSGVLRKRGQSVVFLDARLVCYFSFLYVYTSSLALQTLYHRRIRDRNCYIGNQPKIEEKVESTCPCARVDFEW